MPQIVAAASDEDIRRSYYRSAPPTMWITEMQLDPLQLVVCDNATGRYYRVPVQLDDDDFVFGDPAEVALRYADPAEARPAAIVWASAEESREGVISISPPGDPPDPQPQTDNRPEPNGRGGPVSAAEAIRRVHAAAAGTQTPAPPPGGSTTTTEEARVPEYDATKLTEALQVSPDASPEEKMAAFLNALPTLVGTTVGSQPPPQGTPALPTPTPTPTPVPAGNGSPVPAELAELAEKTGAVLIDRDQLAEMRRQAALGAEAHTEMRRNKRDQYIQAALDERKIAPSSEQHWRTYWDSDPEGCKKALDALQPNLIPATLAGYVGTEQENRTERDYLALFPEG